MKVVTAQVWHNNYLNLPATRHFPIPFIPVTYWVPSTTPTFIWIEKWVLLKYCYFLSSKANGSIMLNKKYETSCHGFQEATWPS